MRTIDPIKHEAKRKEILAAAGLCFARKGFQGATISDICAEAKISPGHLYHYFESKEAIVRAMAEMRLGVARDILGTIVEGPDVLSSLVSAFGSSATRDGRTDQEMILDMIVEASRNPAVATIMEQYSRALQAQISSFLRKGQSLGQIDPGLDPELTAGVLLCVSDGLKTLPLRNSRLDVAKCIDILKILLTRFLTPPKP